MKYVLMAAGRGTRLQPFTNDMPKCLVQLTPSETIIERCIRLIKKYDPKGEIIVIGGFEYDKLRDVVGDTCRCVRNPFFKVTNSIASIWMARDMIGRDDHLVTFNADVVFDEEIARRICRPPQRTAVLYDSTITENGDYNVQIHNDRVVIMGKELKTYSGEYVGITRIHRRDMGRVFDEMNHMVLNDMYDQWFESTLVRLILHRMMEIGGDDIAGCRWSEIDDIGNVFKVRAIIQEESDTLRFKNAA